MTGVDRSLFFEFKPHLSIILLRQTDYLNIVPAIDNSQGRIDVFFIVHMHLSGCSHHQVTKSQIPTDYSLGKVNQIGGSCHDVLQLNCFATHRFGP